MGWTANYGTWNAAFEAIPASTDLIAGGPLVITDRTKAIRTRLQREHNWDQLGSSGAHGLHLAGSSIPYYQAAAPTKLPDTITSLGDDTASKGRLWLKTGSDDEDEGCLFHWCGTSFLPVQALPIGSVVFFSGTFVNNSTFKGWYACDGSEGTPDLTGANRFIRCKMTAGGFGGGLTSLGGYTMTTAALPEHRHGMTAAALTGTSNASHKHALSGTIALESSHSHNHVHDLHYETYCGSGLGGTPREHLCGNGIGTQLTATDDAANITATGSVLVDTTEGSPHTHGNGTLEAASESAHVHKLNAVKTNYEGDGEEMNLLPQYYDLTPIIRMT